jgi:integrase
VSYLRLAEGKGRPGKEDFIFGNTDGSPRSPTVVSVNWRETVLKLGLPDAPFHAWRHCHASYLIDAGLDPVEIARRLGHSSATITLRTYSHAFRTRVKDEKAALAINDLLRVAK